MRKLRDSLSILTNLHLRLVLTHLYISKVDIADLLSVSVVDGHHFYLGLPTFSLRNKSLQFSYIRERVEQNIKGWTSRFVSMGGRKILIKAVLQAVPSYAMSFFKLSISLCHNIEQSCAKFWWNDSQGKRGFHWSKWENLCKPKSVGGLGFWSIRAFNKALHANQIWRIILAPNSLMVRVLKGRYFKDTDIMTSNLGYNPSYIWRSLLWSRDIIKKWLCWRVGNGQNIMVKSDPWIPGLPSYRCCSNNLIIDGMKVESLLLRSGGWNEDQIRQIFPYC